MIKCCGNCNSYRAERLEDIPARRLPTDEGPAYTSALMRVCCVTAITRAPWPDNVCSNWKLAEWKREK